MPAGDSRADRLENSHRKVSVKVPRTLEACGGGQRWDFVCVHLTSLSPFSSIPTWCLSSGVWASGPFLRQVFCKVKNCLLMDLSCKPCVVRWVLPQITHSSGMPSWGAPWGGVTPPSRPQPGPPLSCHEVSGPGCGVSLILFSGCQRCR